MDHAGLFAQKTGDSSFAGQLNHLFLGQVGTAVIRDGHLYPNDFLQKHDVISHRSGQRRGGDFIRAGQTVSGDSLFVKGFGLCQQVLHIAGPGIRPQKSHQRSNARFYAVGKAKLRHTAGKTALPAPACNMHMLVDQPGDYPAAGSVPKPGIPGAALSSAALWQ